MDGFVLTSGNIDKYRRFAPWVEEIAKEWAQKPVMESPWTIKHPVDKNHLTSPWWAVSDDGSLRSVLKPGPQAGKSDFSDMYAPLLDIFDHTAQADYNQQAPVAALEKIISGLARDLGLPVPPVVLYKNGNQNACLSLECFQATGNSVRKSIDIMSVEQTAHFLQCYTAISVFNVWLQNHDPRMENILLDTKTMDPAFIDFSTSTIFHWNRTKDFGRPLTMNAEIIVRPDAEYMTALIQSLPKSAILQKVEQIPESFLKDEDRRLLVEGLLYRQGNLKKLIMKHDLTPVVQDPEKAAIYLKEKAARKNDLDYDFNI